MVTCSPGPRPLLRSAAGGRESTGASMPGNSPIRRSCASASRRSRTASRMSPRPCRPWRTTMTLGSPPCPPEDSHERPFRRGPPQLDLLLKQLRLPTMRTLWRSFTERADREGWPAARLLAALASQEVTTASGGASSGTGPRRSCRRARRSTTSTSPSCRRVKGARGSPGERRHLAR